MWEIILYDRDITFRGAKLQMKGARTYQPGDTQGKGMHEPLASTANIPVDLEALLPYPEDISRE